MNFGAPHINLATINFTPKLLSVIPPEIALRHRVMPIFEHAEEVGVAMADLNDFDAMDAVQVAVGRQVALYRADPLQLVLFVERHYGRLD
ncbi:MAG TPA: hypothetical protein VLD18_13110 [Verrucomicrobiae bacterium]|nr:hypothetical protein [Verrucomicrobiae bacterium]